MTGPLALAILRELVQELVEIEIPWKNPKAAKVQVVDLTDGLLKCEVVITARKGPVSITAGVYAPRTASRRRLRIEMLKAMNKAIDQSLHPYGEEP